MTALKLSIDDVRALKAMRPRPSPDLPQGTVVFMRGGEVVGTQTLEDLDLRQIPTGASACLSVADFGLIVASRLRRAETRRAA